MGASSTCLHKFKAITENTLPHVIDLVDGKLYHAPPEKFNDPHERFVHSAEKKLRACSLSSGSNSNYLMWVHYGGSLNGVSVEFSKFKIEEAIRSSGKPFELIQVQYVTKPNASAPSLREKYFQWFYELEYRVLLSGDYEDPEAYLHVKPEAVAIGEDVTSKNRSAIKEKCEMNGIPCKSFHRNILVYSQQTALREYIEHLERVRDFEKGSPV